MKRVFTIIAIFALCLCSCSKEEKLKVEVDNPTVYHFSLKATTNPNTKGVSFDDDGIHITTQFKSTDKIYIYNETRDAFARDASDSYKLKTLELSDISGNSCTLTGEDLAFYVWNGESFESVDIYDGDTYTFFYQMNVPAYIGETSPFFDYSDQNGDRDAVSGYDFAIATGIVLNISGTTLTNPDGVRFSNLQSMFRQRLSFFKNSDPIEPGPLTTLSVSTKNGTLVDSYYPFDVNHYRRGIIASSFPSLSSNKDIYLSLAFNYDGAHLATDDKLIITLVDDEGNVFEGSKGVPSGGFVNGKYYHGDMNMVWKGQNFTPTITPNSTEVYDFLAPDEYSYNVSSNPNPTIITISGMSVGYYFTFGIQNTTITLDGGPAVFTDTYPFIYSECWPSDPSETHRSLTIILASNYVIDCRENDLAICADDLLKLGTTGGTYTLTVTTNDEDYHGLYGDTNYCDSDSPVSNLAADGFSVSRSETKYNPDGTYTWVYTVTPTP